MVSPFPPLSQEYEPVQEPFSLTVKEWSKQAGGSGACYRTTTRFSRDAVQRPIIFAPFDRSRQLAYRENSRLGLIPGVVVKHVRPAFPALSSWEMLRIVLSR